MRRITGQRSMNYSNLIYLSYMCVCHSISKTMYTHKYTRKAVHLNWMLQVDFSKPLNLASWFLLFFILFSFLWFFRYRQNISSKDTFRYGHHIFKLACFTISKMSSICNIRNVYFYKYFAAIQITFVSAWRRKKKRNR